MLSSATFDTWLQGGSRGESLTFGTKRGRDSTYVYRSLRSLRSFRFFLRLDSSDPFGSRPSLPLPCSSLLAILSHSCSSHLYPIRRPVLPPVPFSAPLSQYRHPSLPSLLQLSSLRHRLPTRPFFHLPHLSPATSVLSTISPLLRLQLRCILRHSIRSHRNRSRPSSPRGSSRSTSRFHSRKHIHLRSSTTLPSWIRYFIRLRIWIQLSTPLDGRDPFSTSSTRIRTRCSRVSSSRLWKQRRRERRRER